MALKPIVMTPAYRYGAATPWGGSALKTVYGQDIPDERTGEALAFSALPGLNSRDVSGRTLTELIAEHGAALLGTEVREPVPLLLKLIDARQDLSVQVHPDDEYAARVEHKLGKTEAWVILKAEPGAQLIYGIRTGYGLDELRELCRRGAAVEEALNTLPVKAGDVVYIPSGTVHAIGAGILLYEIQQSSDVTYRFYDWDRRDEHGRGRELHLDKALDVTRLDVETKTVQPVILRADAAGTLERVLDTRYFVVDRMTGCDGMKLSTDKRRFGILTALADGCMKAGDETIPLKAGQTAAIPADCVPTALTGACFMYAYPQAEGQSI